MKSPLILTALATAFALSACATQPPAQVAPAQANQGNSRIVTRDLSKGGVVLPNPERL